MYKRLGLNMLGTFATHPGGGFALEPSLDQIEQMMAGGKLKIARKCVDLLEEISGYERDETTGKPIPLRDDLIAALRYAVMMAQLVDSSLDWQAGYTLDELKAAILAKWPDAFDAQREAVEAVQDFDWELRRAGAVNPLTEAEIVRALNDPEHIGDRSKGLASFYGLATKRGHTPNEIVEMILAHRDTIMASVVGRFRCAIGFDASTRPELYGASSPKRL
jgi:hypothetical protein